MAPPEDAARHEDPAEWTGLREADNRLLRDVDGLTDADLREPSLLPGWSRAHVVAHLALHAEAVATVLEGVLSGDAVPMYPAREARDAEIEVVAAEPVDVLWDRLLEGTGRFRSLLDRLDPGHWDATFRRLPGEPPVPVLLLPSTRRREVEVHHADLDVGYGPGDWPQEFAIALLERALADRAGGGPLGLRADDLGRTWWLDEPVDDAMVVTGPVASLAWWLVGRGDRAGLHASAGRPPSLGRWR